MSVNEPAFVVPFVKSVSLDNGRKVKTGEPAQQATSCLPTRLATLAALTTASHQSRRLSQPNLVRKKRKKKKKKRDSRMVSSIDAARAKTETLLAWRLHTVTLANLTNGSECRSLGVLRQNPNAMLAVVETRGTVGRVNWFSLACARQTHTHTQSPRTPQQP